MIKWRHITASAVSSLKQYVWHAGQSLLLLLVLTPCAVYVDIVRIARHDVEKTGTDDYGSAVARPHEVAVVK